MWMPMNRNRSKSKFSWWMTSWHQVKPTDINQGALKQYSVTMRLSGAFRGITLVFQVIYLRQFSKTKISRWCSDCLGLGFSRLLKMWWMLSILSMHVNQMPLLARTGIPWSKNTAAFESMCVWNCGTCILWILSVVDCSGFKMLQRVC